MNYELLTTENAPVKMWTKGVPVEADARQQLINTAKMPFIFKHIAVMPDVCLLYTSCISEKCINAWVK